MSRTKIVINYSICGDGNAIDPRDCVKCLNVCDPAVFLMHQTQGMESMENDPFNPQYWRVTPLYPSQCTHCMKCVESCPENAINLYFKSSLLTSYKLIPLKE